MSTYFRQVGDMSISFIDSLSLGEDAKPLEELLCTLRPALSTMRDSFVSKMVTITRESKTNTSVKSFVGLNTVGLLCDRLTILAIKFWCLGNRGPSRSQKRAKELYDSQILDIVCALENAIPGSSSVNSKITHLKGGATGSTFEEAYYGLLASNITLWESQEILYVRDIQTLPAEELRSYIKWFSVGNMERNEYIELCERNFWATKT